jgi:hypothetical protein
MLLLTAFWEGGDATEGCFYDTPGPLEEIVDKTRLFVEEMGGALHTDAHCHV